MQGITNRWQLRMSIFDRTLFQANLLRPTRHQRFQFFGDKEVKRRPLFVTALLDCQMGFATKPVTTEFLARRLPGF